MRTDLSIADPGTLRLGDALISAIFPPLCRPDRIIFDTGTLRLGDAEVSAQLPCLEIIEIRSGLEHPYDDC
jgi:hypothetical protein